MINKKIIYTGIVAGLLSSLISCRNLFSQKKNTSEENDYVVVSGTISARDIRVEPEYDNSNVIVGLDPTISRYAVPDDAILDDDLSYTITAYKGSKPGPEGTIEVDPVYGDITYSVKLSQGTWILVARGYNNETTHDLTTQILEGKSEPFIIDGNQNKSRDDIDIIAEPILRDNGSVDLLISVDTLVNTVIAEWQQKVSGTTTTLRQVLQRGADLDFYSANSYPTSAHFTMKDTPASGGTQVNQTSGGITSVPAGIYDIKINFYKETYTEIQAAQTAGNPVIPAYTVPKETVYVYKNLQTSVWHNLGDRIEITNGLINYSTIHSFCVKFGSTQTTQDGSTDYPFKTLQAAIDKVIALNDGGNYTIYILDDFLESASVNYYSDPEDSSEKGTLVEITTQTDEPLNLTICTGPSSEAEKRTINVNRSDSKKGGIFYLNGSAANLTLTLENLVLTGAYQKNSGAVIGMENGTEDTGAKVILKNCILKDNTTTAAYAGAINVKLHNTLEAYDTVFLNNMTYQSSATQASTFGNGGAIYAASGLTINRCIFDGNKANNSGSFATENKGAGGAIFINIGSNTINTKMNVSISNTTFINNEAYGAGGAIQINTFKSRASGSSPEDFPFVQFNNVVIKNNKSTGTQFAGGIGITTDVGTRVYQTAFSIEGANNQITDNYCSDSSGGYKECNVYLPEDKIINVTGSVTGSTIGITRADAASISGGGGLAFTNGSSNYIPYTPTNVFKSDNDRYIVDSSRTNTNAARIIANPSLSGSITYNLTTLDISLSRRKISYGNNNTITVSVEREGLPLSEDDVEMSYILSSFGGKIEPESGNTPNYFSLDSSNPFKLHFYEKLPKGNYELLVKAYDKKNGNTSSVNYIIENGTIQTLSNAISSGITLAAGQTYSMKSQNDFTALQTAVDAASSYDFAGVTLIMERDIIISNNIISGAFMVDGIGASDKSFKGIFDGDGHSITYYNVSFTGSEPLFQNVSGAAKIRNVKLEGIVSSGYSALVGVTSGEDGKYPVIENVVNEASVNYSSSSDSTEYSVGGIVSVLKGGTIRNCVNKGLIEYNAYGSYADGIGFCGGICGKIDESSLSGNYSHIYNCKNENIIKCSGNSSYTGVGGILGACIAKQTQDGVIPVALFNCENDAQIRGYAFIGGILGKNGYPADSTDTANYTMNVHNCVNRGEITYDYSEPSSVTKANWGYISGKPNNTTDVKMINNANDYQVEYYVYYAISNLGTNALIHNYFWGGNYDGSSSGTQDGLYIYSQGYHFTRADEIVKAHSGLNKWVNENNANGLYKSWLLEDRDDDGNNELHLDLGF